MPPQLAVVRRATATAWRELTDTRTPEFKARDVDRSREYVQVPSKHGAGTIWGKYYGPKTAGSRASKYPIVMFVHGAGYLQNVSTRYPNYFREQMFHNLLVQQRLHRARHGLPRLRRLRPRLAHRDLPPDGHAGAARTTSTAWTGWSPTSRATATHVGIYGGSYGGFMTFMALFTQPGMFKAGAALRPVTDWSQYNHEYTANILNTPELDPEAYKVSSPIEYADRPAGPPADRARHDRRQRVLPGLGDAWRRA